jgi:hypothetical protein
MKQAKTLVHWHFFVDVIQDDTVFLRLSSDEENGEEELEMPVNRYVKMFGRDHLKEGYYGTIVIKHRADGTVGMRGWPYKRKWTQAEIDAVEAQVDRVWGMMQEAFKETRV